MNEIAKTIYAQLGGNRFKAMVGVITGTYGESELSLKFKATASNGANWLKVTYNGGSDLYTVEFIKIRGTNVKTVSKHDDVYADQLQTLFTNETGLYTHL